MYRDCKNPLFSWLLSVCMVVVVCLQTNAQSFTAGVSENHEWRRYFVDAQSTFIDIYSDTIVSGVSDSFARYLDITTGQWLAFDQRYEDFGTQGNQVLRSKQQVLFVDDEREAILDFSHLGKLFISSPTASRVGDAYIGLESELKLVKTDLEGNTLEKYQYRDYDGLVGNMLLIGDFLLLKSSENSDLWVMDIHQSDPDLQILQVLEGQDGWLARSKFENTFYKFGSDGEFIWIDGFAKFRGDVFIEQITLNNSGVPIERDTVWSQFYDVDKDFSYRRARLSSGQILMQDGVEREVVIMADYTNNNPHDTLLVVVAEEGGFGVSNQAPSFEVSDLSINEDEAFTRTVLVSDPENDPITRLALSDKEQVTVTWDHDNLLSISCQKDWFGEANITLTASDNEGNSTSQSFALEVLAINDPPYDLSFSPVQLLENEQVGTFVGTLAVKDVDGGDHIFSSLDDVMNIRSDSVFSREMYDFEDTPSVGFTVRASDQEGLSTERTFSLSISNEVEVGISSVVLPQSIVLGESTSYQAQCVDENGNLVDDNDTEMSLSVKIEKDGVISEQLTFNKRFVNGSVSFTIEPTETGQAHFTLTTTPIYEVPSLESIQIKQANNVVLSTEHEVVDLKVYPNPFTDFITISLSQAFKVSVYQLNGQYIRYFDADGSLTIHTQHWGAGVYVLLIQSPNYQAIRRIIKP